MKKLPCPTLLLLLLLPVGTALAATREAYVMVSNGENIGTLVANIDGRQVDIDWRVDDNGRGSKIRERLTLDERGIPVDRRITGRAWFGAPVDERFTFRNGVGRYRTLSDAGELRAAEAPYYIDAEGSPWPLGLAVRLALDAPDQTIPVAPSGSLRVAKLRDLTAGSGERAITATAYAVTGLGLDPEFLLLDADRRLFARIAGSRVTVREGYEGDYEALAELSQQLATETLAKLTAEQRLRFDVPVYIRNVRVFDAANRRLTGPTTVAVYRGEITGLAATVPESGAAVIIEGEGGTLVPGLFDLHGHVDAWSGPLNLAAGVTTVRDLGNSNVALSALHEQLLRGELMGPRLVLAGFIEGRSPYSARNGIIVDSQQQGLDAVRWYADRGYRQVKLYSSMNPDWVAAISAEAHRLGLGVSGHVPAFMTSERAIRDGYDEINHINQLVLSFVLTGQEDTRTLLRFTALGERLGTLDLDGAAFQDMLRLMKERGTTLDPTLAIFQQMLLSKAGVTAPSDVNWLDHVPVSLQRSRRAPFLDIKPAQFAAYEASWNKLLLVLRRLHDEGIRLVPGTDDIPGFILHSELESWVLAGIPADRVLQLATLEAARYLGLDQQLGSIERGKRADFMLVDGDPTTDITALRRARLVMQGESAWLPPALHAAMGVRPFATAVPISVRK